eukprot:365654-Chlamydomonas_euryale.AAC.8
MHDCAGSRAAATPGGRGGEEALVAPVSGCLSQTNVPSFERVDRVRVAGRPCRVANFLASADRHTLRGSAPCPSHSGTDSADWLTSLVHVVTAGSDMLGCNPPQKAASGRWV